MVPGGLWAATNKAIDSTERKKCIRHFYTISEILRKDQDQNIGAQSAEESPRKKSLKGEYLMGGRPYK